MQNVLENEDMAFKTHLDTDRGYLRLILGDITLKLMEGELQEYPYR
jgi:hypothetical protein